MPDFNLDSGGSGTSMMFSPCGCCTGPTNSCTGDCQEYLAAASFCEGTVNPKCFLDNFGNVYNITSSGWVVDNGNVITFNCATLDPFLDWSVYKSGYLINDVPIQDTVYTITPTGGGFCPSPSTCCAVYPTNVYFHVTSDTGKRLSTEF